MSCALTIKDREGYPTVEQMRKLFESCVRDTPGMEKKFPLVARHKADLEGFLHFDGYDDDSTDHFWVGFALGLRMADRGDKADPDGFRNLVARMAAGTKETTHLLKDGQPVTECCGKTMFELPVTDRATMEPDKATCNRPQAKDNQND